MESNSHNRKQEDFLSVNDLWHLCLAHWDWFVISLLICLGYATYYLAVTPNMYSRQAAILVKQESPKNTRKATDNEVLNDFSVIQQQTNVPNVQRQLVSLEVLSEVARRLEMGTTDIQYLKAAQGLAERIKAKTEDEKSSVINLSITDTDPIRAENILFTTVQVFNEKWLADKNKIAASTSAFIQERLVLLEKELGIVDDSISSFKARNLITDIDRISDLYLQKQSSSDAQILTLNNQKAMAIYILGILDDKNTQHQLLPTNSGINNSVAESQITQYNNMLLQLKNNMYNTSSQNPIILKFEADLADIRNNIVATINNHIKALDIQLKSYIDVHGEANSKITQNPDQAKHLLSVERDQKVKESLYLYLLQKKEENEISTTYTSYITELIDKPNGSDAPISPNSRNIFMAAILLAIIVPTLILFIRENLDNTVRDKFDIERKTNLMLIGEVPLYVYDNSRKKAIAAPKYKIATLNNLFFWHKRRKKRNPLIVEKDKQDIVNEAFRIIRSNVEFMTSKHGDKNVYIVTSNYEGSGKTFVSMNLALALAIKGRRTLLIDGDLRHASTSRHFECPEIGLADYLAGNETSLQNLIITHEEYSSLDILPVGTVPPNPTELLASDTFGKMIQELRSLYDFIIIDCPPALSLADTGIIERQADRTLFIIRSGLFQRKYIDDLEADADSGKYKQMSLILNGIKLGKRSSYRYGARYGYGYNYGYGYGEDGDSNIIKKYYHIVLIIIVALLLAFCAVKGILYIINAKGTLHEPEDSIKVEKTLPVSTVQTSNVAKQDSSEAAKPETKVNETEIEAKKVEQPAKSECYTILLASFKLESTAEKAINEYSQKGLKDCFISKHGNFSTVAYLRFATLEEAANKLRELQEENPLFKDSWVTKVE